MKYVQVNRKKRNGKEYVTYTAPQGIANYPWIGKPDTKFKKQGVFKCSTILEGEPAEEMKQLLADLRAEAYEELIQKVKPAKRKTVTVLETNIVEPECDEEGEETGRTIFKFKQNAVIPGKDGAEDKKVTIPVFGPNGKPSKKAVFGGSTVKVAFRIRPYYSAKDNEIGLVGDLAAVQWLELASRDSDGGAFGFGAEEGYDIPEDDEDDVPFDADDPVGSDSPEDDEDF